LSAFSWYTERNLLLDSCFHGLFFDLENVGNITFETSVNLCHSPPFHHMSSWRDAQLIKHSDSFTFKRTVQYRTWEEEILGDLKEDGSSRRLIRDSTEEGEENKFAARRCDSNGGTVPLAAAKLTTSNRFFNRRLSVGGKGGCCVAHETAHPGCV
jgi:hypothetical protein